MASWVWLGSQAGGAGAGAGAGAGGGGLAANGLCSQSLVNRMND